MYLFQVMNMTMRTAWSSEAGTADPWPSGCSEVRHNTAECCTILQSVAQHCRVLQMCSVLGSDLLLCTAPSVATPAHSPPGDTSRCSVTRVKLSVMKWPVCCAI